MAPKRDFPGAIPLPPNRLDPNSLARLECLLGVSRQQLQSVTVRAAAYYDPFPNKVKVRPFQKKIKPPNKRMIDNPTGELKLIQRKIYRKILKPIVMPNYLCGGVKGRTVFDNVAMHLGAPV